MLFIRIIMLSAIFIHLEIQYYLFLKLHVNSEAFTGPVFYESCFYRPGLL